MRVLFLTIIFCSVWLRAEEGFLVESFSPGQKVLTLTLFDSLTASDLGLIEVEGYNVENAVFIQENDMDITTVLSEHVMDISSIAQVRVLSFQPDQNLLTIETPVEWTIGEDNIICDTSFNGISQKVIQVLGKENRLSNLVWNLRIVPASLQDIIVQCDISFMSRPGLNFTFPDTQWTENISGFSPDSVAMETLISISLKDLSIDMHPEVSGRLRINHSTVEVFSFQIRGSCNITANASISVAQAGIYDYSPTLPFYTVHTLPVVKGLNLKLAHNADMNILLESPEDNYHNEVSINLNENLHIEMAYLDKIWHVQTAETSINPLGALTNDESFQPSSAGRIKFSILPRIEILWGGENGISLTSSVYSSYSSTRNYLGRINCTKFIGTETFAQPVMPGDSNLTSMQDFIPLGKFEQVVGAPPTQLLSISPVMIGTDTVVLDWFHGAESSHYLIQLMSDDTVSQLDSVSNPPAVLIGLESQTEYTFRIIPVNHMGIGIPVTVTYETMKKTYPPEFPVQLSPGSDTSEISSFVNLSWSSSDIDSGDVLLYTLYLDTVSPPSGLIFSVQPDTAYTFRSLIPGKNYFWQVVVNDGKYQVHSQIWEFTAGAGEDEEGREETSNDTLPYENTVLIPEGSFIRKDGNEIYISPFYMHKYEVTQGDYLKITGKNPSFRKGDQLPVENINWYDAVSYCSDIGGSLPTEAQWEYAARAGTESKFYWEDEDVSEFAWYYENSNNRTHPAGEKKPNAWGLFDMSGNVFEWILDWSAKYSKTELSNPNGVPDGNTKVTRGGSWYSDASSLKSSARFKNRPAFSNFKLGFRCAFPLHEEDQVPELKNSLSPAGQ